ncbi:MAG: response regulator transcription factor [Peptoniphilaceae bacterium]|uniref:response regulator transcription factor n=1 Tax=Parvimonas sp. TaxID=1944660 RepID=UPI0025CFB59B|nr:response regulator transcription factor [Parvimonas sp.]MCI5997532.1 response regulator transcription factor [Parvimonas sp.]MDD7765510.1 response regulator transcription factor [Peptoniphilaceae bacterium]MDY3051051.1 response regulator transcription factor [Parvimonas sp.]
MRILICEDEIDLADGLSTILKGNNYSVDTVYDGEQALIYLEAENYDAVVLDIMMPKVDGITVLKTIRKKGNNIPVLMLTAKSQIEDKVEGLDFGADDYLTKPFDIKELLARLRSITRRQSNITDNILSFGNITLNRTTFELSSKDGSFKLASKEFQMLEMFMLTPSHLISVDTFMDKIWGYDTESDISVVWVYISYIRKKLISLNANVEIKVTRNVGYSLGEI